ncbi:MAG: ABC transporter permease subunit [Deltaproteobacteria bacterium]|nr:ABC transporter permease subunit [Deltaproteobacteria bacterium]
MSISTVWTVFCKELVDVLRDRRTLVFMLVVPTLAIPGFMWATAELASHFMHKLARERVRVLVLNPQAAPDLVSQIRERASPLGQALRLAQLLEAKGLGMQDLAMVEGEDPEAFLRLLDRRGIDADALFAEIATEFGSDALDRSPGAILTAAYPPNLELVDSLEPALGDPRDPRSGKQVLLEAVRTDAIAAALELPADARLRLGSDRSARLTIHYLDSSDRSAMAFKGLKGVLEGMGRQITAQRLAAHALPAGFASPIEVTPSRLPGPGLLVKLAGQLLPYLILIFAFLGAMYPAIDLGAGEKERGTLETLLVAPVSRLALVLGKFGVVLLAALISALLATVSLALSLELGFLSELSVLSGGSFSFSAVEVLTVLLLILPVAAIFSALLLALSIFAKSFKEGQSYAGPLQMLILLPAFVSFLPGVKLDWCMASIPVVNVSLALKEIFTGNLDQHWGHVGLIFVSTTVCAAALLAFAAWWFRREQVLFRS